MSDTAFNFGFALCLVAIVIIGILGILGVLGVFDSRTDDGVKIKSWEEMRYLVKTGMEYVKFMGKNKIKN